MTTKQGQFFIDVEDLEFIALNGKSAFDKLNGQNILIIGATSFVGMWVTEAILYADIKYNLGISITLISRNKVKTIERFEPFISSGKILPIYKQLQEVLKSELIGINHVVNLATLTDSNSGDLQLVDNIQMFQQFWSLLDSNSVKNILFTSSGAVYGKNPENLIKLKEEDAARFNIEYKNLGYGLGKISSEFLGFQWAERDNVNFKVARLFSFSGAFLPLNSNYVIGNFIKNVINDEPILIKNPGKVYRSFLYGADMALWLWKILVEGNNSVYNVGSDKEVTTIDLAGLISDLSFNDQKIIIMTENVQNNESYVPNIEKIKKQLSVDINYNLNDGIIKMINWYKKYEKNGI
jgi:nucleoside-diphosphate-sugar epimerase